MIAIRAATAMLRVCPRPGEPTMVARLGTVVCAGAEIQLRSVLGDTLSAVVDDPSSYEQLSRTAGSALSRRSFGIGDPPTQANQLLKDG
jgi:hypothetical protein